MEILCCLFFAWFCKVVYDNVSYFAEWDEKHLVNMRSEFPRQYVKPNKFFQKHFNLTSETSERMHYTTYFNYVLAYVARILIPVCIICAFISIFFELALIICFSLIALLAFVQVFNAWILRIIFVIQTKIYNNNRKSNFK